MTNEEMEKAIKLLHELKEKYKARTEGIEAASATLYEKLNRRRKEMESHLSHSAQVEKAYMILMQLKRKLING